MNTASTIGGVFRVGSAFRAQAQTFERLSTGLAINRGADDPSGLIASEFLGARQAELGGLIRAFSRDSLTSTARDGALGAIGSMAGELGGMAAQAANSGASSDAEIDGIAAGVGRIVGAIDQVVANASFGGRPLLEGFDSGRLGRTEIGTDDQGDPVYASAKDLERLVREDPEAAQKVADRVVDDISTARAAEGARAREQESLQRAAETEAINTAAARSSIRDADYASETGALAQHSAVFQSAMIALRLMHRTNAVSAGLLLGGVVDRAA